MAANSGAQLYYPVPYQNPQSEILPASPDPTIERKQRTTLLWLGAGEIFVGNVSMALAIAALCVANALRNDTTFYFDNLTKSAIDITAVASGTWCGAVLMVTGILEVRVKRHRTRMVYNISAVMSTLSALLMTCQTVLSCISASMSFRTGPLQCIHWPLAVLGIVGIVLAATHMKRVYARSCCRNKRPKYSGAVRYTAPQMNQPQQLVHPQQVVQQQQLVQHPNGQLLIVAAQPVVTGYPTMGISSPAMSNIPPMMGIPAPAMPNIPPMTGIPGPAMSNISPMTGIPAPAMSNIPYRLAYVPIPAEAAAAPPPQPPEYVQPATDQNTLAANITPPAPSANTLVVEDQGKETVENPPPPVESSLSPPEYTP